MIRVLQIPFYPPNTIDASAGTKINTYFSKQFAEDGDFDLRILTFKVGDEVFGRSPTGGCFAEYVIAKSKNVAMRGTVPAPAGSTYGVADLTAYESLVITGGIEQYRGKWIYVAGGGGGVGHFAAQIAKLHGLFTDSR